MKECVICKSTNTDEGQWNTFSCRNCGHRFREYGGDNFEFQKTFHLKFKRDKSEITKDGKISPRFHDVRKWIVEARQKLIEKYLDKSFSVFDIGAGAGTFAKQIKPLVTDIECLEIEGFLVEEIRRLGFPVWEGDFLITPIKRVFDVVFAWHVLEHVEDVRKFLKKAQGITRHYFIMEIPTNRPFKERYEGHLHYFSQKSLEMLLSEFFEVIEIREGVQKPALFAVCHR